MTNTMELKRRYIETPQIRKAEEEDRTVEFIASDSSVDSYGTVLPVDKWDLSRYAKNPVVGYQHDIYGNDDPDNVIGKGAAFVEDDKLVIRVTFEPKEINEKAEKVYQKVLFGTLRGVSVGFAPIGEGHWGDAKRAENPDVFYYEGQELLEVSVVNIPSNANAVRRSIEEEAASLPKREVEQPSVEEEVEVEEVAAPFEEDNSQFILTKARAYGHLAKLN